MGEAYEGWEFLAEEPIFNNVYRKETQRSPKGIKGVIK